MSSSESVKFQFFGECVVLQNTNTWCFVFCFNQFVSRRFCINIHWLCRLKQSRRFCINIHWLCRLKQSYNYYTNHMFKRQLTTFNQLFFQILLVWNFPNRNWSTHFLIQSGKFFKVIKLYLHFKLSFIRQSNIKSFNKQI